MYGFYIKKIKIEFFSIFFRFMQNKDEQKKCCERNGVCNPVTKQRIWLIGRASLKFYLRASKAL